MVYVRSKFPVREQEALTLLTQFPRVTGQNYLWLISSHCMSIANSTGLYKLFRLSETTNLIQKITTSVTLHFVHDITRSEH
jgi:hypothetical protein